MKSSAVIISHHPCLDGFAAATIAKQWLTTKGVVDIKWFPGVYGHPPPKVTKEDIVYVLDFSYAPDVMVELADKAGNLIWIDHHKTAIDEWDKSGLQMPFNSNFILSRDNSASGAALAWAFFFGTPFPRVVKAIDDRDRWKFEHEDTKEICAYGFALPEGDFDAMWDFIYNEDPRRIVSTGAILMASQTKNCEALVEQAAACTGEYLGVSVAAMNCPYFMASECAHLMLVKYSVELAACWYVDGEGVARFSLRSRSGSDIDVAKIAKDLGGGGHKNAAGFSIPFQHAVKTFPFINRY